MSLAVLNPGGKDPGQQFPDFAGTPDEAAHPPLGFHAFAACVGGAFYRKEQAIPAEVKHVLLLLGRDLKRARSAVVELRHAGKTVAVSLRDSGAGEVAALLGSAGKLRLFQEICERADAAIAIVPDLMPIYSGAGARRVEFLPAPYPIEDARWDFSAPAEERRGIFIGTSSFAAPSQNHLAALLAIRQISEPMQEPVTVFNGDGWRGRRTLARLPFSEGMLRVIDRRVPYPRYLRIVGKHRIVWQLDAGAGHGLAAGDALLCRVPCVGGNGTTERLAFPDLCGHGRTTEQLFDLAARLLEHPHDAEEAAARALDLARERLSFGAVAPRLKPLFERLAR